ncbi:hypothetical protein ACKFKF_33945 [Phormidesmis sp. 146-12]
MDTCEQSDRPLPITQLAKKLIQAGMEPFEDFVPCLDRCLVIEGEKHTRGAASSVERKD